MNLLALIAHLQASLGDSAEYFEAQEQRLLQIALDDYSRYKSLTLAATLKLRAGQQQYPAPADFIGFKYALWGRTNAPLWSPERPATVPRPTSVYNPPGLNFLEPVTAAHIQFYGANYPYLYYAKHKINADDSLTLNDDFDLLVLRAQAQAMLELAVNNANKKPSANQSVGSQARNANPMHIHETLMHQFMERVNA